MGCGEDSGRGSTHEIVRLHADPQRRQLDHLAQQRLDQRAAARRRGPRSRAGARRFVSRAPRPEALGAGAAARAAGRACGLATGGGSDRSSSAHSGELGGARRGGRLRGRRRPVRGRNRGGRGRRQLVPAQTAELEVEIARGLAPGRRRHSRQIGAEVVHLADDEFVFVGVLLERLHQAQHGGLAVLRLPGGASEILELGGELDALADRGRILGDLHERDLDLADAHHVLVLEHARADRLVVHGGAVRGAEVLDRPGSVGAVELGMSAGERRIVDRDVVLGRAPDAHVLGVPHDDPLRQPAALDQQVGVDAFLGRGRRHADLPARGPGSQRPYRQTRPGC